MAHTKYWFIASAVALASTVAISSQVSKPTVVSQTFVDYFRPPSSMDDAVKTADAVITGYVRSEKSHQPRVPGAMIRTDCAVEVDEVLSERVAVPKPLVHVYRFGGTVEHADYIEQVVENYFPPFVHGQRYILFLTWNEVLQSFEVFRGADGVYAIQPDGAVGTAGRSELARQQKGRSGEALMSEIRRAAAGKR